MSKSGFNFGRQHSIICPTLYRAKGMSKSCFVVCFFIVFVKFCFGNQSLPQNVLVWIWSGKTYNRLRDVVQKGHDFLVKLADGAIGPLAVAHRFFPPGNACVYVCMPQSIPRSKSTNYIFGFFFQKKGKNVATYRFESVLVGIPIFLAAWLCGIFKNGVMSMYRAVPPSDVTSAPYRIINWGQQQTNKTNQ